MSELKRTPLHDLHLAAGARMVEFGGWTMPVQYAGIIAEHLKVREAAGAFDLSHMGRVYVSGRGAGAILQVLTTNDVLALDVGRAQYSLICNRDGGVRDDVLVTRLGEQDYLLVVNAANREKVLAWMDEVAAADGGAGDFSVADRTFETVMVGVQGPRSAALLRPLTGFDLEGLAYYHAAETTVGGAPAVVSRTGYTGEDGFEVILEAPAGLELWRSLEALASSGELALAGLGARDTLRLEAGMPLYGHELDESTNPLEAGLKRFVRLEKPDFVGREALAEVAETGPRRRLVGLEVPDRAIARQGMPVQAGGGARWAW